MKRFLQVVALSAASMSLAACATVTRGTNTAWVVNTTPPGAKVKTSNGFFCDSTPCALKMPRKSEFTASISKDGYKSVDVKVTNHVSGGGGAGMAGNVILGGVIGAGVDVATGAMLDLTPNPVTLSLEKEDAVQTAATPLTAPTGNTSPSQPTTPAAPPVASPAAATAAAARSDQH